MKIKICGLFRKEDIEFVNEANPDYIGFVISKSRRQVTVNQASIFKKMLNQNIKAVGVFVNAPIQEIVSIVNQGIIDLIQLHGNEDQQYISQLKQKTNLPIIKAISIQDFSHHYQDIDYYLFDASNAGSGRCFDWSLLPQIKKPFFLAGGINLTNIDDALKIACYGIDLSSGVETNGYKDSQKINKIVRRVKYGKR